MTVGGRIKARKRRETPKTTQEGQKLMNEPEIAHPQCQIRDMSRITSGFSR